MSGSAITAFRQQIIERWRRAIRRRSQRHRLTWLRMKTIADRYLPRPRILHPWPEQRFLVNHPRWEPGAVAPTPGSVRGAVGNDRPYRDHPDAALSRTLDP